MQNGLKQEGAFRKHKPWNLLSLSAETLQSTAMEFVSKKYIYIKV